MLSLPTSRKFFNRENITSWRIMGSIPVSLPEIRAIGATLASLDHILNRRFEPSRFRFPVQTQAPPPFRPVEPAPAGSRRI